MMRRLLGSLFRLLLGDGLVGRLDLVGLGVAGTEIATMSVSASVTSARRAAASGRRR
jgi:hypothetical protein